MHDMHDMQSVVGLVVGREWLQQCNKLPTIPDDRTSMTLSLIKSFDLLKEVKRIDARRATREELLQFHSSDYLDFCSKATACDDIEKLEMESDANGDDVYGFAYDCPLVEDMDGLISWLAGGSLAAAESLISNECTKTMNWGGGWHHSHRDHASGFCYVNDIVLAILKLRKKYDRILYIDLDVHHGDGVEDAFSHSNKVFTFSIHNKEPGFFPGTGAVSDVGGGKGKYFTLNIPLKEGADDSTFHEVFCRYKMIVIQTLKLPLPHLNYDLTQTPIFTKIVIIFFISIVIEIRPAPGSVLKFTLSYFKLHDPGRFPNFLIYFAKFNKHWGSAQRRGELSFNRNISKY